MRLIAACVVFACFLGCQASPTPDSGSAPGDPATDGGDDAGRVDGGRDGGTEDAGSCSTVGWMVPAGCAATDIEGRLRCIPNLKVAKSTATTTPVGYLRFDLAFDQPVDHLNPDAGSFEQRLVLLHTSAAAPMVLATSGYQLSTRRSELARTFQANQLTYEHRYFTPSRPVPTDWSKLTVRQAADDAHRISEAFHWLYPARWVNTGASKGGMTSVYHRRFHPCDVDATVAYVAPVTFGTADLAYNTFLENVGGAAWSGCRMALIDLQRRLLMKRDQLTPMIQGDFTRVGGVDKAFELAVLELPFAFWQYTPPLDATRGCAAIPSAAAADPDLLAFLDLHSSADDLASTDALLAFEPYYYQAATELGGAAPYELPLNGLLRFAGANVVETYAPVGVPLVFDPQPMLDVNQWLAKDAERVMLLYGEFDPWSARIFELGNAADSYKFIIAGGNHGARLGRLLASDQKSATGALERWLETQVVTTPILRPEPDEAPERRYPR